MFERIGKLACRFRLPVIVIWVVGIIAALPFLIGIEDSLKVGGFSSESSEGTQALRLLERELGYSPSSFVLIYQSDRLQASQGEFLDQVERSVEGVRGLSFVQDIVLPTLDETLIAPSGEVAYAIVGLDLPPESAQRYVDPFEDAIRDQPDLDIILAGGPAFYADIETASQRDLRRAEFIALPFALIALLFVFGSVVAAIVPLVIGCASVAVILLTIFAVAQFADISIFALNLATMLGLGLAVDYCLFVTSRFREERRTGAGTSDEAVVIAVSKAGRAVFFSGTSVLIGLAGLMLFPLMFLRSVGIAGVIVVAISTFAALTLLPAVLSVVGDRIERFPIGPLARRATAGNADHGFWHGLAERVMKRPVVVAILTIALLGSLGLPFLNANISSPDATILPQDLPSRQGFDILAREYSGGEISPFVIALESPTSMLEPENVRTVNSLVRLLQRDDRIARIQSPVTLPGAQAADDPTFILNVRRVLELFGADTRLDSFISDRAAVILAYPVAPANDPRNKEFLADLRSIDAGGMPASSSAVEPQRSSMWWTRSMAAFRWQPRSSWRPRSWCCCSCFGPSFFLSRQS